MFELVDACSQSAVIKVIGVGGGGGNAVRHMAKSEIEGVDFVYANTDSQALQDVDTNAALQLGSSTTKGLGAGCDPEVGRTAALEDRDRIREVIDGADMLFIAAGMGGGTGTGAAPVVAEIAKEQEVLTVAIVTKPFPFEGNKRMQVASAGIEELAKHVDSLITIPNEKILTFGRELQLLDAFKSADDILRGAVQGIAELITCPGLINVDFADVRTVMSEMGMAMMGSGVAVGAERAREAAESAISSPLLEDIDISGAKGILVNVTASPSLSVSEFEEVGNHIKDLASEDATVVIGTVIDESMGDNLRATLVATGIDYRSESVPASAASTVKLVEEAGGNEAVNEGRQQPVAAEGINQRDAKKAGGNDGENWDWDYIDIPAFLRRQAD